MTSGVTTSLNRTIPSPNARMISSSFAFSVLEPLHAGYPKSDVSKNMASGRFLWDRDGIFFRNRPPLNWLYFAASVAVNAVRTPSKVTYAIGSNNSLYSPFVSVWKSMPTYPAMALITCSSVKYCLMAARFAPPLEVLIICGRDCAGL